MTLKQYRLSLGWNVSKLSQEAGVARATITNAERGGIIDAEPAKKIADALSKATGREIQPWNIEGLNVR